eukprot:299076_1
MWTHLTKGKHTAESISTAPCAALECGLIRLKHSNLQNMPPCIIMHAFSFLDVIDYVCAVSLVCHEWNLSKNDILCTKHTAKLKLLKEIASNSFEVHLKYMELPLSKNDLLYEMETSIAFAILHTKPCYQAFNQKQCFAFDSTTFPPQPLSSHQLYIKEDLVISICCITFIYISSAKETWEHSIACMHCYHGL